MQCGGLVKRRSIIIVIEREAGSTAGGVADSNLAYLSDNRGGIGADSSGYRRPLLGDLEAGCVHGSFLLLAKIGACANAQQGVDWREIFDCISNRPHVGRALSQNCLHSPFARRSVEACSLS